MPNQFLIEVNCPNCLAPIDVREHGRHVTCESCDTQFVLTGRLCPNCSHYGAESDLLCGVCGTPLRRQCPKCQTTNWSGDEYCVQCGTAMDILTIIGQRHQEAFHNHREEQRRRLREVKAQEEMAAQERMAVLLEEEEARQAALRAELARIKAREKKTLRIIYLIGAFFILTFFILLIGSFLSG